MPKIFTPGLIIQLFVFLVLVPFLPILLALWVSGNLQIWRAKGFCYGYLARFAL